MLTSLTLVLFFFKTLYKGILIVALDEYLLTLHYNVIIFYFYRLKPISV